MDPSRSWFKTDLADWEAGPGIVLIERTDEYGAFYGTHAMRVKCIGNMTAMVRTTTIDLPVEIGETYTVSCWGEGIEGNSSDWRIQIVWYNSDLGLIDLVGGDIVRVNSPVPKLLHCTGKAPSGAAFAQIYLVSMGTDPDILEDFLFDKFTLQWGTHTDFNDPESSIDYTHFTIPDTNLMSADAAHLVEPSIWWTYWQPNACTYDGQVTGHSSFGPHSISLTLFNQAGSGIFTNYAQKIPVTGGETYTALCMAQSDDVIGANMHARIRFFDQSDVAIDPIVDGDPVTIPSDGTPVVLAVTAVAPANAKDCILVYYTSEAGATGSPDVYLSAFMLAKGTHTEFVPSIRIIGDLDWRAKVAPASWTEFETYMFSGTGVSTKRFNFSQRLDTNEILCRRWDGAAAFGPTLSIGTPEDGVPHELRMFHVRSTELWTMEVDGVETDAQVAAGSPAVYVPECGIVVGQYANGSAPVNGDIYWMELRDGINGPIVASLDFTYMLASEHLAGSHITQQGHTLTVVNDDHNFRRDDCTHMHGDALMVHLQSFEGCTSKEIVGALNECIGTSKIGYDQAYRKYRGLI